MSNPLIPGSFPDKTNSLSASTPLPVYPPLIPKLSISPTQTSKLSAGSLESSLSLSSGGTASSSSLLPPSLSELNVNFSSTFDVRLDSFETLTPL